MKTQKIKRYRLGISRIFPSTHPRAGEPTYFIERITNNPLIWNGTESTRLLSVAEFGLKLHTIRANYELWSKRMTEVQAGRAVIELFYWEDKPRKSKQFVFATLDKDSGCGVQMIDFIYGLNWARIRYEGCNEEEKKQLLSECDYNDLMIPKPNTQDLAKNDGLSFDDFKSWFKSYDLSEPMAIIHFTSYRY